jgi:hypothetical protein
MRKGIFFWISFLYPFLIFSQTAPIVSADNNGQYFLNEKGASYFANLSLSCVRNDTTHFLIEYESEGLKPKKLWPSFYGCFDWHSCVHNHWCLIKLLKEFPTLPEAEQIKQHLNQSFDQENIKSELIFFATNEETKYYEFPYGQSWLLKVADELKKWDNPQAKIWLENLEPLLTFIENNHIEFWSKQKPEKFISGSHDSPSMGLSFAHDYAVSFGKKKLEKVVKKTAIKYYSKNGYYPLGQEPHEYDFMSGGLLTADLMRKVLPHDKFVKWLNSFCPELLDQQKTSNTLVIKKTEKHDGFEAHWDGYHLNRIWCLNGIMKSLNENTLNPELRRTWINEMNSMWDYAQESIGKGNYDIDHWLSSFSVFALMGY